MGHTVRRGSCPPEQCQGQCCVWTTYWFPVNEQLEPFLYSQQVKGATVRKVGEEPDERYAVSYDFGCQFLRQDGLCGLHRSLRGHRYGKDGLPDRPDLCEEMPSEPAHLINVADVCGFYFEDCDCTDGRHEKKPG